MNRIVRRLLTNALLITSMRVYEFFVYIITNANHTVLYTGVTNSLENRVYEHYKNKGNLATFAGRYNCYHLMYVETFQYIQDAISPENQIKGMSRQKKIDLINKENPEWKTLNSEYMVWPPVPD